MKNENEFSITSQTKDDIEEIDSEENQTEKTIYHKPFNEMSLFEKTKYYLRSLVYGPSNWFTTIIAICMLIFAFWYWKHRLDIQDFDKKVINHILNY